MEINQIIEKIIGCTLWFSVNTSVKLCVTKNNFTESHTACALALAVAQRRNRASHREFNS